MHCHFFYAWIGYIGTALKNRIVMRINQLIVMVLSISALFDIGHFKPMYIVSHFFVVTKK